MLLIMVLKKIPPNARSAFTGNCVAKSMLSLPDFKEKQILFIRTADVKLDKLQFKNENICWTNDGNIENQLSCHKTLALFVIGDCSITSVLIRNCKKLGVSLFLMKDNFEIYAKLLAAAEGNYLLRQKQYALSASTELAMAKQVVANKINNQCLLLDKKKDAIALKGLRGLSSHAAKARNHKELLGMEGSASRAFFTTYFAEMGWRRRMPRTKFDPTNTLMDIGYTLLFNIVDALLALYGFDGYKGFYHKLFFQRKSLSCDIMEPFRCIIDKQILKAFHLKQVDEADFHVRRGRCELDFVKQRKYLQIFSAALMDRREDIFGFVRQYYYYVMKGEGDFPTFKI